MKHLESKIAEIRREGGTLKLTSKDGTTRIYEISAEYDPSALARTKALMRRLLGQ